MSYRRPVTLSRAQERMLYSQLEAPTSPVRFAHALPLLLTFAILIAGLALGWILGP